MVQAKDGFDLKETLELLDKVEVHVLEEEAEITNMS
jgi:hypothetical protein